jgi:hypothetical protein
VAAEPGALVESDGHAAGQAKDVVSANRQFETIEEHVERFLDYVAGQWGQEALHTARVLSEDF